MYRKYFKIAWRNLKRNRTFAGINIIGLSLGMACGIIIFTVIRYHLSIDNFHPDSDRIYRALTEFHGEKVELSAAAPQPLGKAIRNDYEFAEKLSRIIIYSNTLITIPDAAGGNKKFQEENGIAYTEPSYFDIFNFPLVQGNKATALKDPNTALITEQMALKYFGSTDAIGKIIKVSNATSYTITGILKDLPANTERRQQIFLSYDNLKDQNAFLASDSSWGGVYSGSQCFLLLKKGITQKQAENLLTGVTKKYYDANDPGAFGFKLQPLADIHFNTTISGAAFSKSYIYALGFIGLFMIITACVNFINLATAQALNRSKEVGVRKVMGSQRAQLFWQFIAETAVIAMIALVLACAMAQLALPALARLFNTSLSLQLFSGLQLPLFLLSLLVLVIFLAGSYPGLVLARFQPILALKGKLSQKSIGGFSLRRVLVVTQFAISQVLIIGTIVIAGQMRYSQNSDLGFDKDAIVVIPIPEQDQTKMHTIKNRFTEVTGVEKLSLCFHAPASRSNMNTTTRYDNREKDEVWDLNMKYADNQYVSTFNIPLVAGRNLFPSDTVREVLVNETFVKKLNLASPQDVIGKVVSVNRGQFRAPIVGVVKDFHNYSFKDDKDAICIATASGSYRNCAMKIDMKQARTALATFEKIWNETYPDYVFSYQFMDDRIAEFYRTDSRLLSLIEIFCGIAVFIGCLGLYGLVSFMAVRKTKEISIRKVLGAGMHQVLWIFGKEFTRLLLIAFVVAAPLAWLIMNQYLQDYKYRINIGAGIFGIALCITFLIAGITVTLRTFKAALANPVKSLKAD